MSLKVAGYKSSDVFEQLAAAIKTNKDLVEKGKAVYQFNITDDNDKAASWLVDLKSSPGVKIVEGEENGADCTITIKDSNFIELVAGKADAQSLFFSGDLKVDGKMSLAMKLGNLFKAVATTSKL